MKKIQKKNKVIFIKSALGKRIGDELFVKGGYARNFLVPKYAVYATPKNLEEFNRKKEELLKNEAEVLKQALIRCQNLRDLDYVEIKVNCSEDGSLYGSVSKNEIALAVFEKTGVTLAANEINILTKIKSIGNHTIKVKLHEEVEVDITLSIVVKKED